MKSATSLLFLLPGLCFGTPIRIYQEPGAPDATLIREILMDDYQVPEELIGVYGVGDCEEIKRRGKLDLCLKNNGDLEVVSVDKNFIHESLKIFRAP
jgi:DNA/RNA endonuclease YhcR with UshA esterase domain